jgi:hypothetical protein
LVALIRFSIEARRIKQLHPSATGANETLVAHVAQDANDNVTHSADGAGKLLLIDSCY